MKIYFGRNLSLVIVLLKFCNVQYSSILVLILFSEVCRNSMIWCLPSLFVYHKTRIFMIHRCITSILSTYQRTISFISRISKSKVTCAYALPGNEHCVVKLLDTYLSLLPLDAPHFYMRVLDKFPADPTKSCATKQRVGINLLKKIVSELCAQSGIEVYYTNHSLRV